MILCPTAKMNEAMKRIHIGHYPLGPEAVLVILRNDLGGEIYFNSEQGLPPTIVVGGGYDKWNRVAECLHHEAMELAMARIGCRFEPAPDYSQDHGSYLFCMTHAQFSEVSARVGSFIAMCLPDLAKQWDKHRKKLQEE